MNHRRLARMALMIGAAALMILPAAWRSGVSGGVCGDLELVVNTGKCVAGVADGLVRHKSGKLLDLDYCTYYDGRGDDEVTFSAGVPVPDDPFDISNDFTWTDPGTGEEAVHVMFDDGTVIQDTIEGTQIDFIRAVKKFMLSKPDVYHTVLLFPNFDHTEGSFYINIKNGIRGIGQDIHDDSATYATSKLEGFANFQNFTVWPDDVTSRIMIPEPNNDSPMTLLAHELGHRWGAFINFDSDPSTRVKESSTMLGRTLSHWCYFANVPGVTSAPTSSSLEGNSWVDLGTGSFSTTNSGGTGGYSELDLYLMGLAPLGTVNPTFTIEADLSETITCADRPYTPEIDGAGSVSVMGTRLDVTIDSILTVEGARTPGYEESPNKFRVAYVLMAPEPTTTPAQWQIDNQWQIDKLNNMRKQFESYFLQQTGNLGEVVSNMGPVDMDGDGYNTVVDCNDYDPSFNPGIDEGPALGDAMCNLFDDDCDGEVDEGFDLDGDLWTTCRGDCDDTNPNIRPGAYEIIGNGIDENCDGVADNSTPVDMDFDGFPPPIDCDDLNPLIFPEAPELVNEIDDNCNGFTDCQDPQVVLQSEKGWRHLDGLDNDCNDIIDG